MKKLITLLGLIAISTSAMGGIYFRGGLFYANPQSIQVEGQSLYASAIESSAGLTAALGYKFSMLRLEGELNYMDAKLKDTSLNEVVTSGDYERLTVFANFLVEPPIIPFLKPYIGVGIGLSQIDMDFRSLAQTGSLEQSFSTSRKNSTYSMQALAGVRFSVANTVSIYAGYRYLKVEGLRYSEGTADWKAKGGSHIFEAGVGFGF
jgi:opacity protein-like surface antigen